MAIKDSFISVKEGQTKIETASTGGSPNTAQAMSSVDMQRLIDNWLRRSQDYAKGVQRGTDVKLDIKAEVS